MADNYDVKDAAGATKTIRAKEVIAGQFSPRVIPQIADADVANGNPMPVSDAGGSLTVDAVTLPLPTGAASSALQGTGNTLLASIDGKITACNTGSVTVASSALPAGAATAAKQPSIGTAGTPSSDVITVQGNSSGTPIPASLASGELHLGEVGGNTALVSITFTLDTSIYASGDVLADTAVIANALRKNDGTGILQSITLNDKDDQGQPLYVVILNASSSLGTVNFAPSISDANADNIIAIVPVETADWIDIGGCRIATIRNLGIPVKSTSGAATLYAALITRGTPTHTASGITARFGILRD